MLLISSQYYDVLFNNKTYIETHDNSEKCACVFHVPVVEWQLYLVVDLMTFKILFLPPTFFIGHILL